MQAILQDPPIAWAPAAPFWSGADHARMQAPSLLRFTTDDFMDEVQRVLATDPGKLARYVAVPETWRGVGLPAREPNPAGGRSGLFARLGVSARRKTTPVTLKAEPLSTAFDRDHKLLPLKLYQPAQQRFYLVSATLVCQRPGLPDHKLDSGKQEQASFVIRRWFPPTGKAHPKTDPLPPFDSTWSEHAFVAQPDGSFAWMPMPAARPGLSDAGRRVLPGEDRLPLFPLVYEEDDRRTRRLRAGLIPVGKREAYHAAEQKAATSVASNGSAVDASIRAARRAHFRKTVSEPWKALVDRVVMLVNTSVDKDGNRITIVDSDLSRARSALQTASWLILADLRNYLQLYIPDVLKQVDATDFKQEEAFNPGQLEKAELALYTALIETCLARFPKEFDPGVLPNWLKEGAVDPWNKVVIASCLGDALKRLEGKTVEVMDGEGNAFDRQSDQASGWPKFLFPLVDPTDPLLRDPNDPFGNCAVPVFSPLDDLNDEEKDGADVPPPKTDGAFATLHHTLQLVVCAEKVKSTIDSFAALVLRAVKKETTAPQPAVPAAMQKSADLRPGWFTIRCVYERPFCGELHGDVVSASTERFQLAHFFDPDAPARPIRIGLPIDTSPAGLRKFDKNTAFVMSDILCGQMQRMKGLTFGDLVMSVLPFPFHKDLSVPDKGPCKSGNNVNVGMICTLSIPIITICALILLIIMVKLLDLIFNWMPYFIMCFPLPGMKAKSQ